MENRVGFVCFGEVNTPYERLQSLRDAALQSLGALNVQLIDAGVAIDDEAGETAARAVERLRGEPLSALILCVAGWIPTHAVMQVADPFRRLPILLWGLCGWREGNRLVTTAAQAGTAALRGALEAMDYRFKFVYSVAGQPEPLSSIDAFLRAAHAERRLRTARVGTMGYRDMLLYGTQFEGQSLRGQIGVEVEPFEMLEMVRRAEAQAEADVQKGVRYIRDHWQILTPCADETLEKGVRYSLALGERIALRGYEAVTLNDVDGMKKLLGYPPALVLMLLDAWYGVCTLPENDVMGCVTQLMGRYLTGQAAHYMEYYEFFPESVLIGVPDYVPAGAVEGEVRLMSTAFGHLDQALLNVSRVRTGPVTCLRLYYQKGRYFLHAYAGEAQEPPDWAECGWAPPAPLLPSLEVFPRTCTVAQFAQRVASQHVIVLYGDEMEAAKDLCRLLGIEFIQ